MSRSVALSDNEFLCLVAMLESAIEQFDDALRILPTGLEVETVKLVREEMNSIRLKFYEVSVGGAV